MQRVVVDGVGMYWFPPSAGDESGALLAVSSGVVHPSVSSDGSSYPAGAGQELSLSRLLLDRFADRSVMMSEMLRVLGWREGDLRLALRELEERGLIRHRGNWFQFPPVGQPRLVE